MVKTFNYQRISTGNIFRAEIAKASELGNQVKQLVNRGWYVPDDLTNLIVKNKILDLETNHQHFILDGYPRTLEQAQFLDLLNVHYYQHLNEIASNHPIDKSWKWCYFPQDQVLQFNALLKIKH